MNPFNRVVVVVLALLVALAILALTVFPFATLEWVEDSASAWSRYFADLEAASPYLYVGIRVVIVIITALVLGVLLFLETRRRRAGTVRIVTGEGSRATVVTDSVAQRLVHSIDRLADVITVSPKVVGKGRTVHLRLDVETSPEIDVPMKTDEVVAVAREVVEQQMGLQLGKVNVRIRHAPYPPEPSSL